jgi:pimeloyl-ACP methyl ester carboxylesterase
VQAVGDRWVRVGGPARLICHASRPLGGPSRSDGPLVVLVHGALRDSDRYLAQAKHAARLAGADPLIVAPQFLADVDAGAAAGIPDGAPYWGVEGWKGGYPALGSAAVSSFAAMDSLLGQLAPLASAGHDPAVVVFGNSAGGQFVNRYAAVGRGLTC